MSFGFLVAAVLAGVTFVVHGVVGTKEVRGPLVESPMQSAPRLTLWLAWHVTTIALGVATLGFLWAALDSDAWDVGALVTMMAACCAVWGVFHQLRSGAPFAVLPQWSVFLLIALAGIWSLVQEAG